MRTYQLSVNGLGDFSKQFCLQEMAHDVTDFSPEEFDAIASLGVGANITYNEGTDQQFTVTRIA